MKKEDFVKRWGVLWKTSKFKDDLDELFLLDLNMLIVNEIENHVKSFDDMDEPWVCKHCEKVVKGHDVTEDETHTECGGKCV